MLGDTSKIWHAPTVPVMCPIVDPETKHAVARILTKNRERISTKPFQTAASLSAVNDSTVIRTYACDITTHS